MVAARMVKQRRLFLLLQQCGLHPNSRQVMADHWEWRMRQQRGYRRSTSPLTAAASRVAQQP